MKKKKKEKMTQRMSVLTILGENYKTQNTQNF